MHHRKIWHRGTKSGLDVAMRVLQKVDDIAFCKLTSQDVVRHPLVQKIVKAYDEYENTQLKKEACCTFPVRKKGRGKTAMTINIICETAPGFSFHYKKLAQTVIEQSLDSEGFPYEAEVNLTLVDEKRIHEINPGDETD